MAWRLALGLACSLDQIPGTHQVARFGSRLTDTQAQRECSVQHSVSEIAIAGSIARIAQKIAKVGNSGGADVWRSADPNNRMPLPFIQQLEQSLPKNRSVDARTSKLPRRKRRGFQNLNT